MRYLLIAFLLVETLLIAVLVVLDLMLFFIFFETALIPMSLVVGTRGGSATRIRASFLLFLNTSARVPLSDLPHPSASMRSFCYDLYKHNFWSKQVKNSNCLQTGKRANQALVDMCVMYTATRSLLPRRLCPQTTCLPILGPPTSWQYPSLVSSCSVFDQDGQEQ
jgi:hypothetical protein